MINKNLFGLFLLATASVSYALPFSIVPKYALAIGVPVNNTVFAYYTVTNNTMTTRNNNYIKYLPPNVTQITTGGSYPDTCGTSINLASHASCTLQLSINNAINGSDPEIKNHLLVCFPGGKTCAGTTSPLNVTQLTWSPINVAYEIVNIGALGTNWTAPVLTYKNGGSNSITGSAWDNYTPPSPYIKNTTRNLQFNEQIFIASPGDPAGLTSFITTSDGYTWAGLSTAVNAMYPYDPSQYTYPSNTSPFAAGNLVTTPPAGVLKVTANYKAQEMKFYANQNDVSSGTPGAVPITRYYITDPWGNIYIMHASDYSDPADVAAAFSAAVLPAGWTKSSATLSQDFILTPAFSPPNVYEYNLLRDSADNTYHQIYWGASGTVINSLVQAAGMPIWGGPTGGKLNITQSFNNSIFGGGGAHEYVFSSGLTGGINTLNDFNAGLGDTLNFSGQSYQYSDTSSGILITLSGNAQVLLSDIHTFSSTWVVG